MRATLLAPVLALALAASLPLAAAEGHHGAAGCDVDDDLRNHCNVGPVHVVYGPDCVGAALDAQAPCLVSRD